MTHPITIQGFDHIVLRVRDKAAMLEFYCDVLGLSVDRDRLNQIDGAMPRLNAIPQGCAFNPRCPEVFERCRHERPELMPARGTQAACWRVEGAV